MLTDPILLIDLIYKNSKQQNLLLPQITRLVKIMYLAEVEYFRQERERLTELKWRFYLYGPYPSSLTTVLGEPEIEVNEWKTGKISKRIVRNENVFEMSKADPNVEVIVTRLVKEWGDADLNQLLDFVYFETEPMQNAKRGDDLDFSTIPPPTRKKIRLNLDHSKLNQLRKHLAERAKAYGDLRQPSTPSLDLSENLEIWDREEARPSPSGPCRIQLDDLVPE
jgi:Antitoxin SocA-like, Panacea domain